jgi:tetratricopeptide (TPR) repeat protein
MTHHPIRLTRAPRRLHRRIAAAVLALACAGALAAPLDDIRRQVEASQFEQAYQTALANPQLIGDVHFDFLYGVAAINVGRVPEGLLALERHLAAVPANDRARLELARGYFLLGEYARARAEFEFVLRYNPPAGVRANINGFLQAMQTRENVDRRSSARFYVEAGGGYDNNVNGGTFRDEVTLNLITINPSGASRQIADGFGQLSAGALGQWRVTNRLSVFAGADLDQRSNAQERAFDLGSASGYLGFNNLSGIALWRTTVGGSAQTVGGNRYRDALQAGTEASFSLSQDLGLTAFAQYAEQRFKGADAVRDSRTTTLGGNLNWNPPGLPWSPSLGLRLSYSQDDNYDKRRSDLSKQMPFMRVSATVMPWPGIRFAVGANAFQQNYQGTDLGFGTTRKDDSYGVDAVASWSIDNHWSVRGEGQWQVTRSNQDLYDASRKAVSLKLRYQY